MTTWSVGAVFDMPMNLTRDVLKRDAILRRQAMIARHGADKRLLDDDRIVQAGHLRFATHEGQVELPAQQSLRKVGRIRAGDGGLAMCPFTSSERTTVPNRITL